MAAVITITVQAVDQMTAAFGRMEAQFNSLARRIVRGLLNIGPMLAATLSANAIIGYARTCANAWQEQDKAIAALAAALGYHSKALEDYAAELQRDTLYADQETLGAMAQLAVFVKEEEQIKRLIPLVQDFASAKAMPLVSAAELVAKTIGSTTNALSRYGISVSGAVGSMERLDSVADQLSRTYSGWTRALSESDAGQLAKAKNAYQGAYELIGQKIIPLAIVWYNGLAHLLGAVNDILGLTPEHELIEKKIQAEESYLQAMEEHRQTYLQTTEIETEFQRRHLDGVVAQIERTRAQIEALKDERNRTISYWFQEGAEAPVSRQKVPPTRAPSPQKATPKKAKDTSTFEYLSSTYDSLDQATQAWREQYRAGLDEITQGEWVEQFATFNERLAQRTTAAWVDFCARIEGVFDQVWNTITDTSLTGDDKWEAILQQLYDAATDLLWQFIKGYVTARLAGKALTRKQGSDRRSDNYESMTENAEKIIEDGSETAEESLGQVPYVGYLLVAAAIAALVAVVINALAKAQSYAIGTPYHPGGPALLHSGEMVRQPSAAGIEDGPGAAPVRVNHVTIRVRHSGTMAEIRRLMSRYNQPAAAGAW